MKIKVLVVFHEVMMRKILRLNARFDRDFFASDLWVRGPNSTSRLNLANYLAFLHLKKAFDIEFIWAESFSTELEEKLRWADLVVINQVPRKSSIAFLNEFARWARENELLAKVIFGTELTWFKELKVEAIDRETLDFAYFENVLLRHTARTDRELYADDAGHRARLQEFELGIDTEVVKCETPATERKYITFVRAPDGRVTKNNDAIDRIRALVQASDALKSYEIVEMAPPYSTVEYWDVMSNSAFFVFTSNGETFSYCLNDAKALGVISFYPEHMYYSAVGNGYAVESYPWSGIKFKNDEQLLAMMERLALDPDAMMVESARSRQVVIENFSVARLVEKWRALLTGKALCTETLYLFDGTKHVDVEELSKACRAHGAQYAMPYRNVGPLSAGVDQLTRHLPDHDLVLLRYFVDQVNDGGLRRSVVKDAVGMIPGAGVEVRRESNDESARFMQLLCRTYSIGEVVLDPSLEGSTVHLALDAVRVFDCIGAPLREIDVRVLAELSDNDPVS
ncbi:conserved hypothetical protein [Luteimonas sp. 9C]|uniref:glycosyltransferase n=1 Tax=Luteimonas sp. 9C TaxID=2653148 RepID=UPI0012F37150|nr:hypothetical protein [Luteimonas sp. 9C]VXA94935.1 conserved hypothetical protein [Luteimonas sp. 9C]